MTSCFKQASSVRSLPNNTIRATTSRLQTSTKALQRCRVQRLASTKATTSAFPSRQHETLTLLYKATNAVPSVFSFGDPHARQHRHTAQFWDDILSQVHRNLALPSGEPVKVVVCGLDQWAATKDLVTALLSDPLSSDIQQNDVISNRWEGRTSNQLKIVSTSDSPTDTSFLQVSSPYLQQFSIPIELIEFRTPDNTPVFLSDWCQDHTQIPILHNPALYKADIPIIVFNPLTTPLSVLLRNRLPSNAILISSAPTSQSELSSIIRDELAAVQEQSEISKQPAPRVHVEPLNIVSSDPQRALAAIHVLQSNSDSFSAIQRFQDEYSSSNLSSLTRQLKSSVDASSDLKVAVANARIQDSLNAGCDFIDTRTGELQAAIRDVNLLQHTTSRDRAVIQEKVLGVDGAEVKDAIQRAEKDLKQVMDRLTWWKMIWRVDEISAIVSGAITQAWFHNLEKKLVFSAGKLSTLQSQLATRSQDLLMSNKTIASQVLRNQIGQITAAPNYKVTPTTLTQPLVTRRNQMIVFPTTRLHVSGQKAVVGLAGGTATGLGIGWAGWVGWLVGSGEGLLSILGMEANTAIGVGALVAVCSVRWAIAVWSKAKKRWWKDWQRIGEGLNRDLQTTLEETTNRQVFVAVDTACEGLKSSALREKGELEVVGEKLQKLQAELDSFKVDNVKK